jgi:hypothetical protein
MGWNYADLNPSLQKRIALAGLAPVGQVPKATLTKTKGVLNAHEESFRVSYLLPRLASGELRSAEYEAIALPLAHRCVYNPDFRCETDDGKIRYYEVKAKHRFKEKGVLKLKFAAQSYPECEFFLCEKQNGEWKAKFIERLKVAPNLTPITETDE